MKQTIISNLAMINWTLGLVFMMFSNASGVIKKTSYKRSGWKKYKMGYSIKEIKEVINLAKTTEVKEKLKRKIFWRRLSILLLISCPILIFIRAIITSG